MTIYSIKIKSSKKSDIFKRNVRFVLTSIRPPNEEEITVGFFIDPPSPRCNSPERNGQKERNKNTLDQNKIK